jgi:hypothetical protein
MQRLPASAHGLIFGLTMAGLYSGLMSGVFTVMALGWSFNALTSWVRAWGFAFAVAAPAGLILRPLAQAVANRLTKSNIK